jgi:hypothetical protein
MTVASILTAHEVGRGQQGRDCSTWCLLNMRDTLNWLRVISQFYPSKLHNFLSMS